jgi:hypothetical protein
MRAVCIANNPDLAPIGVPSNFNYGLELRKEYIVMGIVLATAQLWYLVDEDGRPDFYPFQLFEISDATLAPNWMLRIYDEDDGVVPFHKQAMWGYTELCADPKHYVDLVLREKTALHVYFRRKAEMVD